MSFRARLTLVTAVAVAAAIALASMGVYLAAQRLLRGQVDDDLRSQVEAMQHVSAEVAPRNPDFETPLGDTLIQPAPQPFGGPRYFIQLIMPGGGVRAQGDSAAIPVTAGARAVLAGERETSFDDVTIRDTHLRIYTARLPDRTAVRLARSVDDVDRTLRTLALVLAAFAVGGVVLAAFLGRLVATTAMAPVRTLSDGAEHVASTHDLTKRIDIRGSDELGRLAGSFNTMLEALERSLTAQRQLVADASHELRTPLTSLRTNIEVLAKQDGLAPDERERLLRDVVTQLEELTALVADVVELARGAETEAELEDVRLDLLVAEEVERARRHAPDVVFATSLQPSLVRGVPRRLARAVANLLDNAAKWSAAGGVVDVAVRDGEVTVRDHGPGIADSDLPHVFDRFYRAPAARGLPGSGLGLAIVRQVTEEHGGSVSAEQAEGGGARFRLRLAG